ncbi:MAG: type II CRISPR-associated endonuclease Cas1 [Mycoplasmoidaceae bacterium]
MGWKILEIENSNKISLFLNNIVILKENNKITIPIKDIDILLLNNYKINISIQLINELTNNNVLTIICDNRYLPSSIIVPIIGHHNTLKIIENQINWNHKWKSETWEKIIKNKISNQAFLIKTLNLNNDIYEKIIDMSNNIKSYDVTNREGHSAKIYWHQLYGKEFNRHDISYTNKLLNYGYAILRALLTRSIIKKGLDPRISIFHKSFSNFFALSSDLMEPFRILVDYNVYLLNEKSEQKFYEDKEKIIKIFTGKILIDKKKEYISNAVDIFIDNILKQKNVPIIELIINE